MKSGEEMRTPQTWLITDTHFGHTNIIAYCRRPFANAEEMNARIIELWNRYVMPGDVVFHLGDVAMGLPPAKVAEIVRGLAGKKILILGNHDHYKSESWWMNAGGFEFATSKILHKGVWLTHHPARELPDGAYVNIHGHLHNLDATDPGFRNNPENRGGHEGGDLKFNKLLALENVGYRPVSWDSWVPKDPTPLTRS